MLNLMPDIFLSDNLPVLILGLVSACSLLLYLLEHRTNQGLMKRIEDASFKSVEEKNMNVLHRTLSKARQIISKTQAKSEADLSEFENEYEQKLSQETSQAVAEFSKYLDELKNQSQQSHLLNEEHIKQRSDEVFAQFEKDLSTFLTSMEQKSTQALDDELKGVRGMIEDYKKQQLSLIEENIISMLEKTLSLVLAKKITLKDQLDLVYEALDKAKVEKFIV